MELRLQLAGLKASLRKASSKIYFQKAPWMIVLRFFGEPNASGRTHTNLPDL